MWLDGARQAVGGDNPALISRGLWTVKVYPGFSIICLSTSSVTFQ